MIRCAFLVGSVLTLLAVFAPRPLFAREMSACEKSGGKNFGFMMPCWCSQTKSGYSPGSENCQPGICQESYFDSYLSDIAQKSKKTSVDDDVLLFKKNLTLCKMRSTDFHIGDSGFEALIENGRRSVKTRLELEIQKFSSIRSVRSEYSQLTDLVSGSPFNTEDRTQTARLGEKVKIADQRARATCEPSKDFRRELPPIRQQGGLGWCYAFATADLYSFKLKKAISASALAVNANHPSQPFMKFISVMDSATKGHLLSRRESTLEGGSMNLLLHEAAYSGICSESDFKSDDPLLALKSIEDYSERVSRLPSQEQGSLFASNCDQGALNVLNTFPGLPLRQINQILASAVPTNVIKRLADQACRDRTDVSKFGFETRNWKPGRTSGKDIAEKTRVIDEQLNDDNIVGITYDPVAIGFPSFNRTLSHASTIVGRRWNSESGSCEYLVRNSWGRTCDYRFPCEDGNVWVPRETMAGATTELDWLHK